MKEFDKEAKTGKEMPKESPWRKLRYDSTGNPNLRKKIKTPEELMNLALDYFIDVDENPYFSHEVVKSGEKAGKYFNVPTMRPYTWTGFETYLFNRGIVSSLLRYRVNADKAYDEYVSTVDKISTIMYSQKFEGATVGAFNANVIIRDLGLADKKETTVKEEQPLFDD